MPDLEYQMLCLTENLVPCPVSERWRLLECKVTLLWLIAPWLLHTCGGEQFNLKTLFDCDHPDPALCVGYKEINILSRACWWQGRCNEIPGCTC